jgi:PPE-repeat protein
MRSSLLLAFILVACSSSDSDPADGSAGGASSVAGTGGQGGTNSAGKSSGGAGHGAAAGQSNQGGAGSGQAGKGQGGNPQAGSAGKGQSGSPQGGAGSGQAGSGEAGQGQAGSGTAGSGQAGSGQAGSGQAGSGQAGSGQAGSGQAGSGQAGSGQAGSGQAGSAGDPFEANRVECVAKINEYRASIGLAPYERWTEGEACADQMADHDADVQVAHDGFGKGICSPRGNGQNECPGYGSPDALDGCLGQMWAEGPTATGEWDVAHGHYMNMVGDYTYMGYHQHFTHVACGFSSKGWFLQNFE